MKETQVEFLFIGIIIIVFALWKITQNIKTRCYESAAAARAVSAARFKEGFGGSGGTPSPAPPVVTVGHLYAALRAYRAEGGGGDDIVTRVAAAAVALATAAAAAAARVRE